jgi:hypothetical protein
MRIVVTTVLALASLLVAAGCKGDSKTEALSDEEFLFAATAAANAVLLTDADLPASFDPEVDDSEDELPDPALNFTGDCAEFNQYVDLETNFINAAAEAESGDFDGDDDQSITSGSAVFRTADAAQEELDLFTRLWTNCNDQIAALFATYFEQIAAEGTSISDISVEWNDVPVPDRGDWTRADQLHITFTIEGVPVEFITESIGVRVGRFVANVDLTHTGDYDEDLHASLMDLVVSRLESQEEKLPQAAAAD